MSQEQQQQIQPTEQTQPQQQPEKKEKEKKKKLTKEEYLALVKEKFKDHNTLNSIDVQDTPTEYVKVDGVVKGKDLWNNNIIWEFAKGLKPGVDLTRIPFPVCITQARSFLQNFTDYFEYNNFLTLAANEDDPHKRMKYVAQWYLSGFAHAMKLVRKPYNPVLGEVFRTMWIGENGSKTHYVAEQVSHHPPISAFYISNREDGWVGNGTVTFSVSFNIVHAWAYLNGMQRIKLLKYDEEYYWKFPPTKASGFYVGPFMMEMGGEVQIKCEKNPFWASFDFKTTSMFSKSNLYKVEGKIMNEKNVVDTFGGQYFQNIKMNKDEMFFDAEHPPKCPQRYEVPMEKLWGRESQYVWKDLTKAVIEGDSENAAKAKNEVEDWQRLERKDDEANGVKFVPRLFDKVDDSTYTYKYADEKPIEKGKEESYEIAGKILRRDLN